MVQLQQPADPLQVELLQHPVLLLLQLVASHMRRLQLSAAVVVVPSPVRQQ